MTEDVNAFCRGYRAAARAHSPADELDPDAIIRELRQQQRDSRMPRVIHQTEIPPEPARCDAREILPDFLRLHAGTGRTDKADPVAVEAWRDGWSLNDIRERSGYSTSDFAYAMSEAVTLLMTPKFENLDAANQTFAKNTDVPNYKPVELPAISMEAPPEVVEDNEFPGIKLVVSASSQDGQVKSYGGRMAFSKSLWSSHGEAIATAIQNYSAVFSALEAQLIASTLESASHSSVSGTGITVDNFSKAAAALMKQQNAAGQQCNLLPYGLMVPADEYAAALVMRAALQLPTLQIIPNAYLAADNWYLFANPALSAPLLRLRLRQGGVPRVYANFKEIESGPKFAVEHTIGFAVVNVPGVVKCAK